MRWFNFFKKPKRGVNSDPLLVDMHSHILPGIDDGAESLQTSLEIILELKKLGYKKLIATPHIMGDYYKNTPEIILEKLSLVKDAVKREGIDVEIDAAAEYYLDEWFIRKLENNEQLLCFGDKYLLFETSFMSEPAQLNEAIFLMASSGFKPVLAHPERYTYCYENFSKYEDLVNRGVLFQINLNSLTGYYSKMAKTIAEKLIEKGMIHFFGTDCHGIRHIDPLRSSLETKLFKKASVNLLNNKLLS